MKVTDLSITLHRWDVPKITYAEEIGGGARQVGVVTIETDEGISGHSFLGSAHQGADEFASQVLQRLNSVFQNPRRLP